MKTPVDWKEYPKTKPPEYGKYMTYNPKMHQHYYPISIEIFNGSGFAEDYNRKITHWAFAPEEPNGHEDKH